MKFKLYLAIAVAFLAAAAIPSAAERRLEIKYDTIRLSKNAHASLTFQYDCNYDLTCDEGFRIVPDGERAFTVKPSSTQPPNGCKLKVTEGPRNAPRQHIFILIYDKELRPEDQKDYDFSTPELIEGRIKYLAESAENRKKNPIVRKNNDKPIGPQTEDYEHKQQEGNAVRRNTDLEDEETQKLYRQFPREEINERIQYKIGKFYQACSLVAKNIAVQQTINKVISITFRGNEDVNVETYSSKTGQKNTRKIRKYFNNLAAAGKVYNISITQSDIQFMSNLHYDEATNTWRATMSLLQHYVATRDNRVIIDDNDRKNVDVILEVSEDLNPDGTTKLRFEVYLGDISIVTTENKGNK